MTNKINIFIHTDNKIYELTYIVCKQTSHGSLNQATHAHARAHAHAHTLLFIFRKNAYYTVCGRLYLHQRGLVRHKQMHSQNQPASTCGQCGKTFNHKDNVMKHLQHCTGHRPPPPQQQHQQYTTSSPLTLTLNHQYSSMGGAVERYNIDMQ